MILNLIPLFFILIVIPLAYADGENIVMDDDHITYPAPLDDDTGKQLQQKADSLFDMINNSTKEMSLEERRKTYPVTSTGIDEQRAAVIVGIDPVYFTEELIPHHFTWIREFLGDEINIVLVSAGFAIIETESYPVPESMGDTNDGVGWHGGSANRNYVPYTEDYNVRFTHDGYIDYDLLILEIMPDIFEDKLHDLGVHISRSDITLNRGPQLSMYQESSSVCGYVIDYTDEQIYWLQAAINSTDIESIEIFTETPKSEILIGVEIEEWDLEWCFGPLKEQIAAMYLKEKSYLTQEEESIVSSGIQKYLRNNPTLVNQEFKVGKFNYDSDLLLYCGEFQKPQENNYYFFSGYIKYDVLKDFALEAALSPLCAISEDAKTFPVQFSNGTSDLGPSLVEGLPENKECKDGNELHTNKRGEAVCVFSVTELFDRGYLV